MGIGAELPTLEEKATQDPQDMPEIVRELTMLKGVVSSLHGRVNDMIGKVHDITRPAEPSPDKKLSEAFQTTAPLAIALREITDEVSTIEDKVTSTTYRIAL